MASQAEHQSRLASASLLFLFAFLWLSPRPVHAQDSADDMSLRGDRAEISVTVRDSSGELVRSAGNVKLYRDGMMVDQSALSHGRAFFLIRLLGNYTLAVDAAGYKPGQRDVNVPVAVKYEVDVNLQRTPAGNEVDNVPGKPVLAP